MNEFDDNAALATATQQPGGTHTPSPAAAAQPGAATPAAGATGRPPSPAARQRLLDFFAEQPPPEQWAEPRPLVATAGPADFPLGALPPVACEAALEVLGVVQAPEALVATCALGLMAATAQGLVDVARDPVLRSPSSLYMLALAVSGERKTSIDTLLSQGLRQWEEEQQQMSAGYKQAGEAALRAWQAQDSGISDALRKAAREGKPALQDDLTRKLAEHALQRPQVPRVPSLLRGDDTPERLLDALAEWPVRAVVSSEAGVIFGSHGMSPEVVMRNLAQSNTLWDGGRVQQGRVGRGDVHVDHARLTLSLQLQPAAFEAFCSKAGELARGIGYFARFLTCYPDSRMGTRFYKPPPEGMPAVAAFNACTLALLRVVPNYVDRTTGHVRPYLLRLDEHPTAKERWVQFFDSVEIELGKDGALRAVQDVASKIADNAARLWAVFMVYAPQVDATQHMLNACRVALFYLNEAQRFRTEVDIDPAIRRAMALEAWIVQRMQMQQARRLPMWDVTHLGPQATRAKGPREEACELLTTHGRIALERDRSGKVYIWVSPHVRAEHGVE